MAGWDAVGAAAIDAVQKHWMDFIESISSPEQEKSGDEWEMAIGQKIDVVVAQLDSFACAKGDRGEGLDRQKVIENLRSKLYKAKEAR
jgi:hypothetical protein